MSVNFWRRLSQIIFFILLIYGGFIFKTAVSDKQDTKQPLKSESIAWVPKAPAVIDVYVPSTVCKFTIKGGLVTACPVYFLTDNLTFLTAIKYLLSYILILLILGFLMSKLWCGWICPLGSIEDAINYVRKKLGFDYITFSKKTHKIIEISKYTLLGLALVISLLIAIPSLKDYQCYMFLPYCQICPARIIYPLFGGATAKINDFTNFTSTTVTMLAWLFLVIFILASLFGRRIWCRLCPISACHEFFNRGGAVELTKDAIKCNRCGICAYSCPVEYKEVYEEKQKSNISHRDCILCLRCVEMCPKKDCLQLKFFGKKIIGSSFKERKSKNNK